MRIPRATVFQLTHIGLMWAGIAALVAHSRFSDRSDVSYARWLLGLGLVAYFAAFVAAHFGFGPLGRRLSDAARQDERDSWNRPH